MRFAICLLLMLAVLATGQLAFEIKGGAHIVSARTVQSEPSPKIMNARLSGKKLIITGENFSPGAVILVDGKPQKTKNDGDNPTSMLIAKKAGKKIASNQIASLTVKNPTGAASDGFGFFKGRTVTLNDGEKTIEFNVGDKFILVLNRDPYKWEASVGNTAVLRVADDVLPVLGAIAIFEVVGKGQTGLTALGSLACHSSNPPCLAPSLRFEVNIVAK